MRIALLSDIQGNAIALEAMLADFERQRQVDEIWILGDLLARGAEPKRVLERLDRLRVGRVVHFVRGNTDRFPVTGERPPPF